MTMSLPALYLQSDSASACLVGRLTESAAVVAWKVADLEVVDCVEVLQTRASILVMSSHGLQPHRDGGRRVVLNLSQELPARRLHWPFPCFRPLPKLATASEEERGYEAQNLLRKWFELLCLP